MKEFTLSFDGVTALFREIHKVEDTSTEMSQSGDGLHFDGVHL